MLFKTIVTNTLSRADVAINGDRPWDIQVLRSRFYWRTAHGSLGMGESYIDHDWEVTSIDDLFRHIYVAGLENSQISKLNRMLLELRARISNLQNVKRARAVTEEHYDLDYRMYEQFLGPYNQYSCCFFDGTEELEQAEINKLEITCEKLEIQAADHVLDIGCGWGGFARYAASTRGCHVTGVTLSKEQAEYARKYTSGLPVDIVLRDYRELPEIFDGRFDKILCCGMIEHVGYKNYVSLMEVIHQLLEDDGLFLLQTIGSCRDKVVVDPWIEKHIFRNSMVPSTVQLARAMRGLFVVHDRKNYGHDYSKTLSAWQSNFERNWETIKALKSERPFDEKFRRMWNYYLLSCKAAFDVENLQLWQIVMSKQGMRDSACARVKK